jgi:hypothetical protein
LFLLALGCGPSGESVQDTAVKVTGQKVELAEFSAELPQAWKVADLTAKDIDRILDSWGSGAEAEKLRPVLKAAANQKMYRLFAFDIGHTEGSFTDNLNVVILPARGITLQQVTEANATDLKTLSAAGTSPKMGEATFAGQPFGTSITAMNAPGNTRVTSYAYFTVHKDQTLTFTFTCVESHAGEFGKTAEAIMNSVRLK